MTSYTKKEIGDLVDGRLPFNTVHRMLSMPKDVERFDLYLKVLQERVSWPDQIILPRGPHLYIVVASRRVV
jgi:acetone carboxylase gamma subunit